MRTIAVLFIMVFFGAIGLFMAATVLLSLAVSLAALGYRLIPGPNVPLTYNLRNMFVRWKNTAVTGVAFTVVIALLIVMLAFISGMNRLTEGSGRPGNVMVLQDGSTDESFS